MYEIHITVCAADPKRPGVRYKKTFYRGIFVPKANSSISVGDIKKWVINKIKSDLSEANKGLTITVICTHAKKLRADFVFTEN
jgi:hypothetical protein